MEQKRIAVTMGDPAGIGPEVVVKALANKEIYEKYNPLRNGRLITEELKKPSKEEGNDE